MLEVFCPHDDYSLTNPRRGVQSLGGNRRKNGIAKREYVIMKLCYMCSDMVKWI